MSRTTEGQYRCDHCKVNLTTKEHGRDAHITLELGTRSGIASDRGPFPGFRIIAGMPAGQYHLCSASCARDFFDRLLSIGTRQMQVGGH